MRTVYAARHTGGTMALKSTTLILLLLGLAATTPADGPGVSGKRFRVKPITLGAHRGGKMLWPENTLEAFQRAATRWPDILLEGDATCTTDGHVVLLHDATVDRTTNGSGAIAAMTFEEVKALDAGYRFTPDGGQTYPWRGKGVRIPTLIDVLDCLPESRFLIELKPGPHPVAEAVHRVLCERHALERVVLASFIPGTIGRVRLLDPRPLTCFDVVTGAQMMDALRGGAWDSYVPVDIMLAIDLDMMRHFGITAEDVVCLREKGILINPHTINRIDTMCALLDMGVDGMLTDCPDVLAQVIHERERTSAIPDGILLEAEAFDVRVAPSADFAIPTTDRAASGEQSLYRFFTEGHVGYHFSVDEPGAYAVWLRYASNGDTRLPVALGPRSDEEGEPACDPVGLAKTGGLTGYGVWQWACVAEGNLAPGAYTFVMAATPLRPDCLFIARAGVAPSDTLIAAEREPVVYPTAAQALIDAPLANVRSEWVRDAAGYPLPEWFDKYRVQAHTRFGPHWMDDPEFLTAADGFRKTGARVFTRHIKSGDEAAWWPSAVGAVLPEARERDWAKAIIDTAHGAGCRIIVYHRHMEDAHTAREHPDWVCREPNGAPKNTKRGDYLCLNSPYLGYLETRLLELVHRGADGFYFDETHMPKDGCWCEFCQNRFREETGLEPPREANRYDPLWQKYIDFKNLTIERAFVKLRTAIHRHNPEVVMLISANTWPAFTDRNMTHRLWRIADSVKTEFSLPARVLKHRGLPEGFLPFDRDAKIALGYTLARDAADGRPPHVWTNGLLNADSAVFASAGMMAHGCIANLDIPEDTLPNSMFTP
ncbi:MAG TPA: hypothetical protein ENN80_06465, partial [Candidatus Hydrogenedentes bacterium]|nr:hypothetical protein [Candidatus Hydrogenedentota bacterium]